MPTRAITAEQARLLDRIAAGRGRKFRSDVERLVAQAMQRVFRRLSRTQQLSSNLTDVLVRLLLREEESVARDFEQRILVSARTAATLSANSMLDAAHRMTGSVPDSAWARTQGETAQKVAQLEAAIRGVVRLPVLRSTALLFAELERLLRQQVEFERQVYSAEAALVERGVEFVMWRVVRIVRATEAWAFNVVRVLLQQELSDGSVVLRWTELVDDTTGIPKDDRVAIDSEVMHGQLAVDGRFTMPPDTRVRPDLRLKTWAHPPNRPNDRAVLVPWLPDSGVPAWEWRDGERVPRT